MSEWLRQTFTGANSVRGASLIMVVTLLLSNILGLVRDRFLAQKIPTDLLDTYFAAFRIPDLLFNVLILGAVTAAFVPLMTEYFRRDEAEAWKIANTTLNVALIALTVLAIIVGLAMPWLTPLVVPSFDPVRQQLTTELARWLMIQPVLFGASYLFSGVLTARKRFVVYALAPLAYNASIIGATLVWADAYHVRAVIGGVVVGALLHLSVQALAAGALGWRWVPTFDLRHQALRRMLVLMVPRSIGLGGMQFVLVVFTALASSLAAGSVAIYSLSDNIQTMPLAVFAISFATALFPTLADAHAAGDEQKFTDYLVQGIRSISFLVIPAAVGIILLRAQIVRLILGSGYFDWAQTIEAANTLGLFAVGLIASGLVQLFTRAFYARQNTRMPTTIALVSYLVMIGLGYLFSRSLGVAGLALAFSVGSIVQAAALYVQLRELLPAMRRREAELWFFVANVSVAVLALIAAVQLTKLLTVAAGADMTRAWGVLLQTVLAIVAGVGAYFAIAQRLAVPELSQAWQAITARLSARAERIT